MALLPLLVKHIFKHINLRSEVSPLCLHETLKEAKMCNKCFDLSDLCYKSCCSDSAFCIFLYFNFKAILATNATVCEVYLSTPVGTTTALIGLTVFNLVMN